jgi:hypothetical protein
MLINTWKRNKEKPISLNKKPVKNYRFFGIKRNYFRDLNIKTVLIY